jgi:hypothetical protein
MDTGTFANYPRLVKGDLPTLIMRQRRLASKISIVAPQIKEEKALREQIDELLVAAGLKKSDVVTCNGYDVRHNERDGQVSIDGYKLSERLVAGGVDRAFVNEVLEDCTETGAVAKFATVTPTKGAKVRR